MLKYTCTFITSMFVSLLQGPLSIEALQKLSEDPVLEVTENDPVDGYMRKITATLRMSNIRGRDVEGMYQCVIANSHGQQTSKEAFLYYLGKTMSNVCGRDVEGLYQCVIANNHGQQTSKEAFLYYLGKTMSNVRGRDVAGKYQCVIANNHGQQTSKEAFLYYLGKTLSNVCGRDVEGLYQCVIANNHGHWTKDVKGGIPLLPW